MKKINSFVVILLVSLLLVSCTGEKQEDTGASNNEGTTTETSDEMNKDSDEKVDADKKEDESQDKSSEEAETKDTYNGTPGKITVYISGPQTMIEKLEQKFEAERGDVIEIFHAGCGPLRQKIWAEAEANNINADVFWGSNPLIYYKLDEKGLLMPYESPEAANIVDEYKIGGDKFAITSARYEVLVYSKKDLSPEQAPKAYAELLDEKWKDKMAYTDLSQSSTAFALSTALWDMNDRTMKFFEGIKANNALIVPKSKTVADKIQSGEIQVGIVPHDAIIRLTKKAKKEGFESNLAFKWPSDGAIRLERPIAIIKNDARPEENTKIAKEFVDFILSKPAQEIMLKFGFVSPRNDVEAVKGVTEDLKVTKIDWKEAGKSEEKIREDFRTIMSGN